jgi:hypothetical protein
MRWGVRDCDRPSGQAAVRDLHRKYRVEDGTDLGSHGVTAALDLGHGFPVARLIVQRSQEWRVADVAVGQTEQMNRLTVLGQGDLQGIQRCFEFGAVLSRRITSRETG